jgi:hypothetical protein
MYENNTQTHLSNCRYKAKQTTETVKRHAHFRHQRECEMR